MFLNMKLHQSLATECENGPKHLKASGRLHKLLHVSWRRHKILAMIKELGQSLFLQVLTPSEDRSFKISSRGGRGRVPVRPTPVEG